MPRGIQQHTLLYTHTYQYYTQRDSNTDDAPDEQALVIVKFLETVYHSVPSFKQTVSSSQEFIEALAATLFPPPLSVVSEEEDDDDEVINS